MSGRQVHDRLRRNDQDEIDNAAMADAEPRPELAAVYRTLGVTEARHAAHRSTALRAAGEEANQRASLGQMEASDTPMAADERSHAAAADDRRQRAAQARGGSSLARIEGRHRAIGGNALRSGRPQSRVAVAVTRGLVVDTREQRWRPPAPP